MITCKLCGKKSEKSYSGKCQACYVYFKQNGRTYPLPEKGKVSVTVDGKTICHICGRAYRKLGQHAYNTHGITEKQYKEKFELNRTSSLISDTMKDILKNNVLKNYDKVVVENLINKGINTRTSSENKIKEGKLHRLEDKIRRGVI